MELKFLVTAVEECKVSITLKPGESLYIQKPVECDHEFTVCDKYGVRGTNLANGEMFAVCIKCNYTTAPFAHAGINRTEHPVNSFLSRMDKIHK